MRYGWRARIGHISPAILDTSGEEMRKLLPEGVLHVGLTISEPIQTLGEEQAAAAFARLVEAGKKLAAENVDVLICGGAPVALSKGRRATRSWPNCCAARRICRWSRRTAPWSTACARLAHAQ